MHKDCTPLLTAEENARHTITCLSHLVSVKNSKRGFLMSPPFEEYSVTPVCPFLSASGISNLSLSFSGGAYPQYACPSDAFLVDLIITHTPISTQTSNFLVFRLQLCTFIYFFLKAYVVGSYLNCLDLLLDINQKKIPHKRLKKNNPVMK